MQPGVLEIIGGAGVVTPVKSWSNADMGPGWTAFATTIDAAPLRGALVTFRMRVSPTAAPATRYFFDSLSVRADRCP